MKTLLYPKTYARLVKIIDYDQKLPYKKLSYTQWVWVFEVLERDSRYPAKSNIFVPKTPSVTISQVYPRSSGHTPSHRVKVVEYKEKWRDIISGKLIKRKSYRHDYTGNIFKLYQRPQDGERWSYRWLGQ